MILSKVIVNQVVKYLIKHFQMDKIMSYVFNDNELDKKVKSLENKVESLEEIAHPEREFVMCEKCKHEIKEKNNG